MTSRVVPSLNRRAVLVGLSGLGVAAPFIVRSARADDWPSKPINITVSLTPGGGMDTLARVMAPFLQQELGTPIVVDNRPGGGELLAHKLLLTEPDDGYHLLSTVVMPYMAVQILTQDVGFKLDDFAIINLPRNDYTMIATPKKSRVTSAAQLIDALRKSPGGVTIGVGEPSGADYINLILFLQELGVDPSAVRIVNYAGGGDLRTAIAGGQVDVAFVAGLPSIPLQDIMNCIMVFTHKHVDPWNAPTLDNSLKAAGISAEPKLVPGALGGFVAKASFRDKYPDRWDKLVAAFKQISNDPEKAKKLTDQTLWADWYGPQQSTQMAQAALDTFKAESSLLKPQ